MADKSLLEQMLERLVNEDQAKAEELFHEYVVAKSREIYENLIDSELEEASEDEDEDEVDEAMEKDEDEDEVDEAMEKDEDDNEVDEEFEDIAIEGDDEEMPGDDMGGDPTDELEGELGDEDEEDMGEKEPAELFQDLDAIVDELQAKFDAMGGEMGGEEGEMKDAFEPEMATVREYVEKVPGGHGAEKKGAGEGQYSGTGSQSDKVSVNAKSLIDNMKNDMGGTTANILSSKEDAPTFANQGQLKGNGLLKGTPKEENAGNINVPGGNAGKTAFKKKEPGHGAEKKGAAEGSFSGAGGSAGSTDKASLFRGRR